MITLIADIRRKISSTGSNISERLEDKLTGDFFGSLRYIPFNKAAREILSKTRVINKVFSCVNQDINTLDIDFWDDKIQFWPYDSLGELDILIEFESIVIGIEVKLDSPLSSNDDVDNSNYDCPIKSNNQLSRESRIIKKKIGGTNKSALLILIAPEYVCHSICKETYERNIIEEGIFLGHLSWEEILITLKRMVHINEFNKYEKLIIMDLIALLISKRLERFKNFDIECPEIDADLWFQFNGEKDSGIEFTFYQWKVMGEGYYEFK